MPFYDFKNIETGEVEEHMVSLADYDQFKKDNPHLERVLSTSAIISGTNLRSKIGGFNEVLDKIAEKNPDSPLGEQRRRKSIKEIKTKEIVKKHIDIQNRKK
jgi:hypothetical protein